MYAANSANTFQSLAEHSEVIGEKSLDTGQGGGGMENMYLT